MYPGSQTAGAKVRRRKGKSPDRQLRPPIPYSVVKVVELFRQPGRWLRSSHRLKKA